MTLALYINTKSNHPPHIFQNMPAGIAHRIATKSRNEEIFKQAEPPYKEALKQSKFTDEAIENGWKFSVKDPKKAKKRKKGNTLRTGLSMSLP